MNDPFIMKGKVKIKIEGKRGTRTYEQNNLIVDSGKNVVRDLLRAGSGIALSRIALGTGTTSATVSDTGLETQVFIKNITSKDVADKTLLCKLFVTTTEVSGTFNEVGLFAGSTLFSRIVLLTPIEKAADETLYLEWEITF